MESSGGDRSSAAANAAPVTSKAASDAGNGMSAATISTGALVIATSTVASRTPAANDPAPADTVVDRARERFAIVQYPAGALNTELWKSVGDMAVASSTSVCNVPARTSPSPFPVANTDAIDGLRSTGHGATACVAAAMASRAAGLTLRRSVEGRSGTSSFGSGSGRHAHRPQSTSRATTQSIIPGAHMPTPTIEAAN